MLNTGPWYRRPDAPLLVGHLMASAPPRSGAANAAASALSILLHASLVTVAVLLVTGERPRAAVAPPGFDIVLPTEAPPPPLPPPPAVPPPEAAPVSGAPRPIGFPTLTAPIVIPDYVPAIRPGPVTDEAAFSGWGTPGGDPRGKPPTGGGSGVVDIANAPVFVPHTLSPELKNVEAVRRALVRAYPAMLRDAGVTGRVLVWVLVDERGQVLKALVKQTSGVSTLDDAALGVARTMEFTPGMNGDIAVKVWVAVPIDFRVGH